MAYDTFNPSGSASTDIARLQDLQDNSYGTMMSGSLLAGSPAAQFAAQRGALQTQQTYDPWGYYRPAAAEQLANQTKTADPSNMWRAQLTNMVNGKFSPQDPSYKWRYDQGQQAVERSLAAKGLLNSGNAGIELQQYGQGAASQEYGAQFNRLLLGMAGVEQQYSSQQDRLMKLAGVDIGPGVLAQYSLGDSAQVAKNNYLSNVDAGIASTQQNDPYAGYTFG